MQQHITFRCSYYFSNVYINAIPMYILYDGNKSGFDLFHVRIYMSERNRRCSFRVLVRALVIPCVTISFKVHRLIYHGIFWTCSRRKKNVQKLIYYNNTKCSQTVNKVLKDEELSTNAKDKLKHWVEWPCKKDNLSRRKYFLKIHF